MARYKAATTPHWNRRPDGGYILNTTGPENGAELMREGRMWFLVLKGKKVKLGPRATFDTAERALAQMS